MKRLLMLVNMIFILMTFFTTICLAEEEHEILQSGDYTYYINDDGTVTIAGWNGEDSAAVIPTDIEGMKVTGIADGAFFDWDNLISVEIPDSISEITFNPFGDYSYLEQIIVSPENEIFEAIDNVLFNKKEKSLICYPAQLSGDVYAVPEGIQVIEDYAFCDCIHLTNIEIPDSVTEIGDAAFRRCQNLTSINIPDSVKEIGDGAFFFCPGLTSIELPASITVIGTGAFLSCDQLTLIVERDSYAANYCEENGLIYTYSDANGYEENDSSDTSEEWTCSKCGSVVQGNFCNICGAEKPSTEWICPNCGETVSSNFCNRCGTAREDGSSVGEIAYQNETIPPSFPDDATSSDISDNNSGQDQYICPDSSLRYLSDEELEGMTAQVKRYALNEIYARHGRLFVSEELSGWFSQQEWYQGYISGEQFDESVLNEYEKYNIALFQRTGADEYSLNQPGYSYAPIMEYIAS